MAKKDNSGPPNRYEWGKNHFDTLATAFNEVKHQINGCHGWNRPVEQTDGLTLTFEGRNMVKVSHVKYVVASPYRMNITEKPQALEFLNAIMKEVGKKYKNVSKTAVSFKKIDERQDIELYSKLSPDQSWAFGTSYVETVGRYMVTTSRIYSVESKNLKDEQ